MDKPEFILLFRAITDNSEMTHTDSVVFGFIYWMTKLKNEKCYASNETLADLTGFPLSTVRNSLTKLEKFHFIRRLYDEFNTTKREEIQPLMGFSSIMGAGLPAGGVLTNQQGGAGLPAVSINKSIKEEHYITIEDSKEPRKPGSTLDGFDSWWSLYPRKANRVGASAEWRKLSSEDRAAALRDVSQRKWPDPKFVSMPDRYLRDHRWEDEQSSQAGPKTHKF